MRTQVHGMTRALSQQRGMTLIGMLLVLGLAGAIGLVALKTIPMYIDYFQIKSSIESLKKESSISQMTPTEVQYALQKRFDISFVKKIAAKDLKVRHDQGARVIELIYVDEAELFKGLFVTLKVNEIVPIGR